MKYPGTILERLEEDKLWGNIRRAAKSNPGLQELLDQVIIYYRLMEKSK